MTRIVLERKDLLPLLEQVFKTHGYQGATLAVISKKTGLGKGSLYHFFPRGKEQMAEEVLKETDRWFERTLMEPLKSIEDPRAGIEYVFDVMERYYESGGYICLPGVFSLSNTCDMFSDQISAHFNKLLRGLTRLIMRTGRTAGASWNMAVDIIGMIEGSLVMTHALRDKKMYGRMMKRMKKQVLSF